MRRLLLVLACVLPGSPVWAQTNECDVTPPSATTKLVGQPIVFGWCHSGLDTNTPPGPANVTEFRIIRNGVVLTPSIPVALGPPNAAGQRYQETTRTETVPGKVTFELEAVNAAGVSARSPFAVLTVSLPPARPAAATNLRVR